MLDPIARKTYDTDGFCHLPGLIPTPVLSRLQALIDRLLVIDTVPRKVILDTPVGKVVSNVDNLIGWGDPVILELYALPEIMEVAQAICGPDFFPIQEFAVIKHGGDGHPVLWHRDMFSHRSGPALTMGIYLDDAGPGRGALRYVPGSHLNEHPICDVARDPAVEVPAQAGDVIIHDMMTAHSSDPLGGDGRRRVIYLEFVSVALALAEELYPADAIAHRRRLLFAARRYRRETNPGGNCFKPRQRDPEPRDRRRPLREVLGDILSQPFQPQASLYCFDPIPANLA